MNKEANQLNKEIEKTIFYQGMSEYGKSVYFPKGIVWQAEEAKEKSGKYNATVGLSRINGKPFYQKRLLSNFTRFEENQVVCYAPCTGEMKLRKLWKKDLIKKNPLLETQEFSLPIVTSGLTHALSICTRLFIGSDDTVLIGGPYWDNYDLLIKENLKAKIATFDILNIDEDFEKAIDRTYGKTKFIKILFNFPNNPTGFTPSEVQMKRIAMILKKRAETGQKVLVLCDDAYFGLFYDENCFSQSLFALLCNLDENLLAIKIDGATKENLSWGLRIGFITYASKNFNSIIEQVMKEKTASCIRSSVSSSSKVSQSLLIDALSDETGLQVAKDWVLEEMRTRYNIIKNFLLNNTNTFLKPLEFNSGYFMCFKVVRDGEIFREFLLKEYQIGTISFYEKGNSYLRIAYCSIDKENLQSLFSLIFEAADRFFK
ncbi:MAG: aminotransferase class I/II-fold pyridoxal phosphate-dependent enzyme [Sphaerochaetaceae bacterium]|nr:aminotransferase class I/II-fold pyridoxal phosphate-dependent enzyme [Sphaerochaetaceae bacterium]